LLACIFQSASRQSDTASFFQELGNGFFDRGHGKVGCDCVDGAVQITALALVQVAFLLREVVHQNWSIEY
jgi:hypothetical protein